MRRHPDPAREGPRPERIPAGWLLLLPLALAAAAYARVLHGEFQLDDYHAIVANPAVKDLAAVLRGFGGSLFRAGRPVADLTFALDYAAGRLDARVFHATSLAVHLAATGLVYLFTREALRLAGAARAAGTALAVAGLFAVHPLQSQAVSYVVQRAEALASALYLAALLLLLRAERRGVTGSGAVAWSAGLLLFLLGMGAKVVVVTLPAAYLLLAAVVPSSGGRPVLTSWPRRLAMLAPWVALDAFLAAVTLGALRGHPDAGFSVPAAEGGSYLLTELRAVATYVRLLLWPAGQSVDWSFRWSGSPAEPAVVWSGLLLLGLLLGAALLLRRGRRDDADGAAARVAAFGILWFFLLLAPTSSVVPIADALVEHRVYLASWGLLVAAAAGAERALARLPDRRRGTAAVVLVGTAWAALSVALWRRNAVWETRVALWSDVVSRDPRSPRARRNLAFALLDRGDFDGAVREYRRALRAGDEAVPENQAFVLNNLGVALLGAGREDDALAALRRGLELAPADADLMANLALALWRKQDLPWAERWAGRALEAQPGHAGALEVLGGARLARGDAAGAVELLSRAVRADPDDPERWFNLATALRTLGRTSEACGAWAQVLRASGAGALAEQARTERARAGCGATP